MDIDTMMMYFKILKIDVPHFFNEVMAELEQEKNDTSCQHLVSSQCHAPIEE